MAQANVLDAGDYSSLLLPQQFLHAFLTHFHYDGTDAILNVAKTALSTTVGEDEEPNLRQMNSYHMYILTTTDRLPEVSQKKLKKSVRNPKHVPRLLAPWSKVIQTAHPVPYPNSNRRKSNLLTTR